MTSSEQYTPQAWRMTDYYPESYAKFTAALGIGIDYDDDDYARYEAQFRADLAAHDAKVQAEALRDAARRNRKADQGFRLPPAMFADWLDEEADRIEKGQPQ